MDYRQIVNKLVNNKVIFSYGEAIKAHTSMKIKLISNYLNNWLYVASNSDISDIYFIDLMSNSGIYKSGELATYVEALNHFGKHALDHPDKHFHLICNDYDLDKFQTIINIKKIYELEYKKDNIANISIEANNKDAVLLLNEITARFKVFQKRLMLLFVDPYCMLDSKLALSVINFANNVYSELIINYYFNDYIRNYKNEKAKDKMNKIHQYVVEVCRMDPITSNPIDIRDKFVSLLLNTKTKFRYIFTMRNSCNGILYYLLYLTPNLTGLKKVKEATWKSFGCKNEYSPIYVERDSPNIFGETDEEEKERYILEDYKEALKSKKGCTLSYEEIQCYILQETPLPENKIIDIIIKPLIKDNLLLKLNFNGKRDFKRDNYLVL